MLRIALILILAGLQAPQAVAGALAVCLCGNSALCLDGGAAACHCHAACGQPRDEDAAATGSHCDCDHLSFFAGDATRAGASELQLLDVGLVTTSEVDLAREASLHREAHQAAALSAIGFSDRSAVLRC